MTSAKNAPCPFEINSAKRAIKVRDSVSACLVTGSDKISSGFGNGDCILIDMHNLVFAVADASDRFPTASRELLRRLSRELERGPAPADQNEWLDKVNRAYAVQPYIKKSTFSGVAIDNSPDRKSLYIIHGGDSLVLVVNLGQETVKYMTCSDMNFAGRVNKLAGIRRILLEGGRHRIIIASDGLADLARLAGMSVEEMCVEVLGRCPVDELPVRFFRILRSKEKQGSCDDISIIVLDPARLEPVAGHRLLLGGTSALEEARFQRGLHESQFPDRWVCFDATDCDPAICEVPGFEMLSQEPNKK